ncbi:flagellar basal body L-ring protein FlgH [Novosphingobium sp.]|uniref:flagellar basal body L-ring protein FlgH n=1 Tax=Novosphingobium sp. TaxID=1874826 RepID=UPI0025FC0859|nr:flagellar basal body L-ring protein FlgH [Novosphingobium sp.]MCC6924594.1 flagellar basal body L-ring protein FlgH [Novosphingobium sp.]
MPSAICKPAGLVLGVLAFATQACAGPKPQAGFEAALPPPVAAPRSADGSIFNPQAGYAALYTGHRAQAVGDPLTIVLVEQTSTSKSAGSKSAKSGSFGVTPPASGPLSFIKPESLAASGNTAFKGDGSATQASTLAGELSVTIAEVRPNGTALVRGQKRLMLSQGEEWVQLSGIVRLSDLDADNRVASTRVADARITYAGNGPVSRASREGWLSKFFNMISPF